MAYGLTDDGFIRKPLSVILAEIEQRERDEISSALDVSSSSPIGQLNGTFAAQLDEMWALGQAVYAQWNPDMNTGAGQDAVAAVTGTTRLAEEFSYVDGSLGLDTGAQVPAGSKVSVQGNPGAVFELIGALEGFPESLNEGSDVPSAGPAPSAGSYRGRFRCVEAGPTIANAGTLTVIVTPETGWNSFTADGDAVRGRLAESHSDLRERREDELFAAGSAPLDAIKSDLLQLLEDANVEGTVTVFENTTLTTDANGLPGKSIECLVFDGVVPGLTDEAIAQQIFDSKAAGIQTYGTTGPVVATDDDGNAHDIYFSRPTNVPLYFDIDIQIDASRFPVTGDDDIKTALATFALDHQRVGLEVAASLYYSAVTGIAGVKKISAFRLGISASPSGTADIAMATRELATLDTGNITINHV